MFTLIVQKSRMPQIQGVQGWSRSMLLRTPGNAGDGVSSAFAHLGYYRHGLCLPIDLGSHWLWTERTQIFIFVAFGNNKQKTLADRNRTPASWAVQFRGLKFFKRSWVILLHSKCIRWIHTRTFFMNRSFQSAEFKMNRKSRLFNMLHIANNW